MERDIYDDLLYIASKLLLDILQQIYEKTLNNDNNHALKNSYQLVESINRLKNNNNIVTFDFKDLFNNINLRDLNKIINSISRI